MVAEVRDVCSVSYTHLDVYKRQVEKPLITIRDMVLAHQKLADYLKISSIDLLLGGSLGGMQCLEWSIINPDFIKNLFVIATNCKHSSWGIAFNEAQRLSLIHI